jgi:hypothetical protein
MVLIQLFMVHGHRNAEYRVFALTLRAKNCAAASPMENFPRRFAE